MNTYDNSTYIINDKNHNIKNHGYFQQNKEGESI